MSEMLTHYNYFLVLPQAPKRFMWMSMMMAWSLWSLSALRWARALSLFGPRITRLLQTPHAWPSSLKGASKYLFVPHFSCNSRNKWTLLLSCQQSCKFISFLVVPLCCHLQVQSYLQQSLAGGSGYLLLCCHQHWRHLFQLHTHWGGWVSPRSWHLCSHAPETSCTYYLSWWRQCWRYEEDLKDCVHSCLLSLFEQWVYSVCVCVCVDKLSSVLCLSKLLYHQRLHLTFIVSDIHPFCCCCCCCYLTGLLRLLDISHEHKFPGEYPSTSHTLLLAWLLFHLPGFYVRSTDTVVDIVEELIITLLNKYSLETLVCLGINHKNVGAYIAVWINVKY